MADLTPADVLGFWLGPLDDSGCADAEHRRRWWKKDPAFDDEIRRKFADLHAEVVAGKHDDWLRTPRGRLAVVIVLDQLSRNMFRGSPETFAHDALALKIALDGIDAGDDRRLQTDERVFLYMPLMHAEDLPAQDRCIRLFEALRDELDGEAKERVAGNVKFAVQHRDIVARFGRFPHRNAVLGREPTEEESAFLKEPGSSF